MTEPTRDNVFVTVSTSHAVPTWLYYSDESNLHDLFNEKPCHRHLYWVSWPYPERTEGMDGEKFTRRYPRLNPNNERLYELQFPQVQAAA